MKTAKKQKTIVRANKKNQTNSSYYAEYQKVANAFLDGFRIVSSWHYLVSFVYVMANPGLDSIASNLAQKYKRELIKVPEPDVLFSGTSDYKTALLHYYNRFVHSGLHGCKKLTVKELQEIYAALLKARKSYERLFYYNCPESTLKSLLKEITEQTQAAAQKEELAQKLSSFSIDCLSTLSVLPTPDK